MYINEHLMRQKKQLLGAAITQKRSAGCRYDLLSGGRVFAQKDKTAHAVRISSIDDLTHEVLETNKIPLIYFLTPLSKSLMPCPLPKHG